jgi:cytochrome c peroxidase
MSKTWMIFYSSLVMLGVMASNGCEPKTVQKKDNISKEILASSTDDDLHALLVAESKGEGLSHFILPSGRNYDAIPQDPKNPLNSFKVLLGKKLFCEPALAIKPKQSESKHLYSCASCHVPMAGFSAGIKQGIGEGGLGYGTYGEARRPDANYLVDNIDVQPIKTPSIINGAYNRTTIWNGQFGAVGPNVGTEANWRDDKPTGKNKLGFEGVETQAIAGMEVHRLDVDPAFIQSNYYKEWFDLAFPEVPETERYSLLNAGLAIAAFERTVLAEKAPFQLWLKGEKQAITASQKQGAMIFFGKGQCNNCHDGPALNSEEFFALGVADFQKGTDVIINKEEDLITAKKGRGGFTKQEEDLYKFKTPQLYSMKKMGFYGHGGSFKSIREIIEYKNQAQAENSSVPTSQIAADFQPLGLTDEEIDLLTDFVENALNDDEMERFAPTSLASGMCFPNNDPQSREDMGCVDAP